MKNPLISIIIPTYNRADFIGEAISSVMAQTFADFELLIVDDASTDDTEKIVRNISRDIVRDIAQQSQDQSDRRARNDERIRYIRQPRNVGISRTRNIGIAAATGTYIAMLDSDDVWLDKEKLAKQVAFLEAHPDHVLVGTWIQTIGQSTALLTFSTTDSDIRQHILLRNQFAQSSVLFLKKAAEATIESAGVTSESAELEKSAAYDPSLTVNEDYDLWLRIGKKFKFANIADATTGYRVHTGSIIREKRLLAASSHLAIIKKYRNDYPRFGMALVKGYARLLLAYFT